jgi:hypothetical protein
MLLYISFLLLKAYGIAIIEACKTRVAAYQEELIASKRSKATAVFNIHDLKAVRLPTYGYL